MYENVIWIDVNKEITLFGKLSLNDSNIMEQVRPFDVQLMGKLKKFYFIKIPNLPKPESNIKQLLPIRIINIPNEQRFYVLRSQGLYFTRLLSNAK